MNQTEILFVSDAHLSVFKEESTLIRDLGRLITSDRYAEIFFIGDMFDFYFDYKHFIPKQFYPFFSILERYSAKKKIHIMPGNHDLWLGTFFKEYLGCEMLHSPQVIERFSKRILVMHGDELFHDSFKNRLVSSTLKGKLNIFLFGMLHPEIAYNMGRSISFFSKSHKSNDYLIEKAVKKIEKLDRNEGFDLFISGHIHKSYLSADRRICITGDFRKSRTFAVLCEKGVSIEHV